MKLKLHTLFYGFILSFSALHAQDIYSPLAITGGYTQDVIANGTSTALASTTSTVDVGGFVFLTNDYISPIAGALATALPASGTFTSAVAATPGLTFNMGPYSGNNSLRLSAATPTGTLTFADNNVGTSRLYLLGSGGDGLANITGTITFSDNTTQAITSTVIPDWFNSTTQPIARSGFARVGRGSDIIENPSGNPRLYQIAIDILTANQTKFVRSIDFTRETTSAGVGNIFAVSAIILPTCPSPKNVTSVSALTNTTAYWEAPVTLPAGGYDYYVSTSATAPTSTTTPTGNVANTVNQVNFATTVNTKYYFWVRAKCSDADKGFWISTFVNTAFMPAEISTGFNSDVIANGTGSASASTTIGIDNANLALVSADFKATATAAALTYGLPVNGVLTSLISDATAGARKYKLANYTGNNSLRLVTAGESGTLTFTNPVFASNLYVLVTSGTAAATLNTTINFADGTSQTGAIATLIPLWTTGTSTLVSTVYSGSGTVNRTNDATALVTGQPRLFELTLAIGLSYKSVASITFTKAATPVSTGAINILAVTTQYGACSVPATPTAQARTFCKASTVAELAATGTTTGATVNWYSSADSTTPLAATDALATGTYYVAQKIGNCESNRWSVRVVVTDLPAPTAAAEQTFCTYATVSELVKTGEEGVSFQYYLSTDLTKEIGYYEALVSGATYSIKQSLGTCTSALAANIKVTISHTDAPTVISQLFCDSAKVSDLKVTAATGATVKWYATANATESLAADVALENGIYYVTQTTNACESIKQAFEVVINSTPVVDGDDEQDFTAGETIADLDITTTGNNTVKWYTKNAAGDYIEVPTTTELVDKATYYVQQSSATCSSEYYAITVNETDVANTGSFKFKNLVVYPNPAVSTVTVTNNDVINHVTVTNLLGQTVIDMAANSTSVPVSVDRLAAGTYILQIQSAGNTATVKVVKQ